jgi:hypothetical protein
MTPFHYVGHLDGRGGPSQITNALQRFRSDSSSRFQPLNFGTGDFEKTGCLPLSVNFLDRKQKWHVGFRPAFVIEIHAVIWSIITSATK